MYNERDSRDGKKDIYEMGIPEKVLPISTSPPTPYPFQTNGSVCNTKPSQKYISYNNPH